MASIQKEANTVSGDVVDDPHNPAVVYDPHNPAARDENLSYWTVFLENKKAVCYVTLTAVSPMMFGFDNIIVGVVTAMPAFQMKFGTVSGEQYIIPAMWLSLWNAFVLLGVMVGAVANGYLSNKFGRKVGFTLGGIISTASIGCMYASNQLDSLNGRRGVFLLGKTILGIALGLLLSSSQTYVSEVAPTKLRGPFLAAYTLFMSIGQLIAITLIFKRILIFNDSAFTAPFAGQWAFSGIAIIAGLVLPETPLYCLRIGNVEKAKKAYQRLHSAESFDAAFTLLRASIIHEESIEQKATDEVSVWDCFKGSDARRTRIIIWANILQQLLGITLIANGIYFLQLAGMSPKLSLTMAQVGISSVLVANVLSWYTMTRFGRRAIMLASTFVVGLLWLSVGISGCFSSPAALWYMGVCMMVITFAIQCGVGSAWPVVSAETSSLRLRQSSQTIAWVTNAFSSWLFNFVVPYLFDVDQANLGGKIGFVFFVLCGVGFAIIFVEIPEMKGRSYTALDEMFHQRVPTRKFPSFVCREDAIVTEALQETTKSETEHRE